jgi:hypothetical protein
MRTRITPSSFKLWLSANDTYSWAHKPGAAWPSSQLSGSRLFVEFDSNGLCDLAIDGLSDRDCNSNELTAIVADSVKLPAGHPCSVFLC